MWDWGRRSAPAQHVFPPAHPSLCLQVSHHKRCRFRVTVTNEAGEVPQEGHKVVLAAVMVMHKA